MLLLSLLIACTCGGADPDAARVKKKKPRKAKAAQKVEIPEPPPGPPAAAPVAMTIKVTNDSGAEIAFDRAEGMLSSFGLARLDGEWTTEQVWLESPADPQAKDFISRCVKICTDKPKARDKGDLPIACDATAPALEKIAAGASLDIPWSGNILANRKDQCVEKQGFEAGKYLLTFCPEGGACAATEVQLPSTTPVEIKVSQAAPGGTCETVDRAASQRAVKFSARLFGHYPTGRTHDSCPTEPRCTDAAGLDAALKASKPPCNSVVVPDANGDLTIYLQYAMPMGMPTPPPYKATWDRTGTQLRSFEMGK